MRQISLVGAVDEEAGDFFPEFLNMLEESPFLKVSPHGRGLIQFWIMFPDEQEASTVLWKQMSLCWNHMCQTWIAAVLG